ncbi:hypothetical protein CVU75_00150 [Candidatus Dependentiae bacterium HGW-Dependentiae-1]|nr:MAG: hypothetical protein CVU75_00150 [Candidatus Dependentiae bacterium HGW-Dependentiae-1]
MKKLFSILVLLVMFAAPTNMFAKYKCVQLDDTAYTKVSRDEAKKAYDKCNTWKASAADCCTQAKKKLVLVPGRSTLPSIPSEDDDIL